MANFIEALKVIFLGIVEGITEWLPISSTGHMLLVDQFLQLNESQDFKDMFFVVIQLGAIMAVVLLFWNKMWPFQRGVNKKIEVRKDVFSIWFKVVVACVPGAVITLLFDRLYRGAFSNAQEIIAAALILYGIAFILIEIFNKKRRPKIETIDVLHT